MNGIIWAALVGAAALAAGGTWAQEGGLLARGKTLSDVAVPAGSGDVKVRAFMLEAKARGTALAGDATRIVGYRPAAEGAWPWQVSLLQTERLDGTEDVLIHSQFYCGTRIGRQWYLNSTHLVVTRSAAAVPSE